MLHRVLGVGGGRGLHRDRRRQTEVHDLGVAAPRYENISRFDVAMHDALRMRGIQRIGHVDRDLQHLLNRHRFAVDQLPQGDAVQKFHDDECLAVLVVDLVNGADVGMIERGGGARFTAKALQHHGIVGNFRRKKLDGDKAAELEVFRLVNHAHAANPKLFQDAVMGDGLVDHWRGRKRPWHAMLWRGGRQVNALQQAGRLV